MRSPDIMKSVVNDVVCSARDEISDVQQTYEHRRINPVATPIVGPPLSISHSKGTNLGAALWIPCPSSDIPKLQARANPGQLSQRFVLHPVLGYVEALNTSNQYLISAGGSLCTLDRGAGARNNRARKSRPAAAEKPYPACLGDLYDEDGNGNRVNERGGGQRFQVLFQCYG